MTEKRRQADEPSYAPGVTLRMALTGGEILSDLLASESGLSSYEGAAARVYTAMEAARISESPSALASQSRQASGTS
jgi:hypothetical protein